MVELVEKFYKVDLSEAEESALEDLLASSPEAADLFADLADQAYARYGLPDSDASMSSGSWPRKGLWTLLGLVLLLSAGYAWKHFSALGPSGMAPKADTPKIKPSLETTVKSKTIVKPQTSEPVSSSITETKAHLTRLKVNVEISQAGPVTVRFLASDGTVAKTLYTGQIAAGKHAFRWDKRLEDGRLAPAGKYSLEVRSGSSVETRDYLIGKK